MEKKEVSCKAFQPFFGRLAKKGVGLDRVVAGTSVTIAELRSRSGRMSWADLCAIHRNLRQWFDDEDLDDVGRSFFRARALRFVFVIARVLLTPMGFYKWLNTPRQGAGNQFFSCVVPSFKEVAPDECVLEMTLPDGYEVAWDFFLITRGSFAQAPTLFGHKSATVRLERLPNGGRFFVKIPGRTPFLTRVRRALAVPFTLRAAANELKAANEDLVERYEQLTKTTAELENYKTNLENMVAERTRELTEARDQLAVTVEQLKEAQLARERFFGNISHEIRTPLSLIMLAAADIDARAGAHLDARAKKGLGSITDGARKLVRLVDELLLLAARQEDKLKLHPEPTDVVALVDHVFSAWLPMAEQNGLVLAQTAPPTLAMQVDPVAMERVISNLVSNAMKYTPRGGKVDLVVAQEPSGVCISVLDTGPGIDEELASRLFGRFERAAGESRRKVGTGIGLSLVRELVQAHGGRALAKAREGGGAEMRVELPAELVIDASKVVPRLPARQEREVAPAIDGERIASGTKLVPAGISAGTILIAEDDPDLAQMIARLLAEEYTVVVALDGQAAAELIPRHQPHLLVTDVDMPRMNGLELAARFRELTGDRVAPIIILSAVLDLHTRVAGLEAGAIDYVTKPFDPSELRARVRAQFRMREIALRLHRAEQVASLGILVAGLAHEIRNPANGIVNAIEPLKMLLPPELAAPESGVAQLVDVVGECAKQIAALSRQLLGFRSGGELEVRTVELPELVRRAVLLAQPSLAGVDVRTQLDYTGELRCAPTLLVQVLTNLIENGAHAVGQGGWVEISTRREGGMVTVEVGDSGAGVPVALRERVFEPFFTTKPQGLGTGLGLAVSRAIVARHGGVLDIRERGARAVFVIELPSNGV